METKKEIPLLYCTVYRQGLLYCISMGYYSGTVQYSSATVQYSTGTVALHTALPVHIKVDPGIEYAIESLQHFHSKEL